MKKILLILCLFVSSGIVFANSANLKNVATPSLSIIEALNLPDNSYVSVQGHIVKKLTDDKYIFQDKTGTMTVEIDNDRWAGVSSITKNDLILTGEIEKKQSATCLDVESVQKVAKR